MSTTRPLVMDGGTIRALRAGETLPADILPPDGGGAAVQPVRDGDTLTFDASPSRPIRDGDTLTF